MTVCQYCYGEDGVTMYGVERRDTRPVMRRWRRWACAACGEIMMGVVQDIVSLRPLGGHGRALDACSPGMCRALERRAAMVPRVVPWRDRG